MEGIRRTVRWLIDNPTAPDMLSELPRFTRSKIVSPTSQWAAKATDHDVSDYHHAMLNCDNATWHATTATGDRASSPAAAQ